MFSIYTRKLNKSKEKSKKNEKFFNLSVKKLLFFVFLLENFWRNAVFLLEKIGKIILIVEVQHGGYLLDGQAAADD